jgi:hypothetical protein
MAYCKTVNVHVCNTPPPCYAFQPNSESGCLNETPVPAVIVRCGPTKAASRFQSVPAHCGGSADAADIEPAAGPWPFAAAAASATSMRHAVPAEARSAGINRGHQGVRGARRVRKLFRMIDACNKGFFRPSPHRISAIS